MTFAPSTYKGMYSRFLGPLAKPVTAQVLNDGRYTAYQLTAHVTQYRESDLVSGGTVQLGDLRLIVLYEDVQDLGLPKLGLKDRFDIDGRTYSIVHWDEYSRSVGDTKVAVEITVRGGGLATIATRYVIRITGDGDTRITGDGDTRAIKEAI